MKNLIRFILPLICLCASVFSSRAQGWEKKYSPDMDMGINCIFQNPDKSITATGWNIDGAIIKRQRVMKLREDGSVISQAEYDSIASSTCSNVGQNRSLYILGFAVDSVIQFQSRVLMKINSAGQKVWLKRVHSYYNEPGRGIQANMDIDTTDNGGVICSMAAYDSSLRHDRLIVKRLDANGDLIWAQSYFDSDTVKNIYQVRNSGDGGFLVNGVVGGPFNSLLFKIDGTGTKLWQYSLPVELQQTSMYVRVAKDGDIFLSGTYLDTIQHTGSRSFIAKLNQTGQQLWLTKYPALIDSSAFGSTLIEKPNNKFVIISGRNHINGRSSYVFTEMDSAGAVLIQRPISLAYYGVTSKLFLNSAKTFVPTVDGGYVLGGWLREDVDHYAGFVIKMDSAGVVFSNEISGRVFDDTNLSCQYDSGESGLKNVILSFTGRDTFQVATDATGNYWAEIDTGSYQVATNGLSPYWASQNCNATQINIPVKNTDTILNYAMKELVRCPYIKVDGSIYHIRTCIPGYYYAQYCNQGTAPLNGGQVAVEVDTLLVVDSASIPLLSSTGNTYFFKADTLQVSECASFVVYFHTPCDQSIDRRTACIRTTVSPENVCYVPNGWDQSHLQILATCNEQKDSVQFKLKNVGTGVMSNPQNLIVIEDNVILRSIPIKLNPGAEINFTELANGATYRASVQQTANNPVSRYATAAVEGCGVNQQGTISKGFINDFPFNGEEAFENITCSEINNSYDPNHKSVTPEGIGASHLTDTTTEFEYMLEFQNTGNDTAYQVRLVDTLASYLDPATIQPGLSSHKYNFGIEGNGVISFTFVNINLPDSGHNQLLSSGFVKFRVKQRANNADGTIISNQAAFYFDFNKPVFTNTVFNTIGRLTLTEVQSLMYGQILTNAYPNPVANKTIIKVTGENFKELELIVYDLTGKKIKEQKIINTNQFEIDANGLNAGNYLFEIRNETITIGRGKLAVVR